MRPGGDGHDAAGDIFFACPSSLRIDRQAGVRPSVRQWFYAATAAVQAVMLRTALGFFVSFLFCTSNILARGVPDSFAELAANLSPAVVNISTTQAVAERSFDIPEFPPGSPFEDFFREFFDRHRSDQQSRKVTSLGSGFIIDASGYIVTNSHVISDAVEITVLLHDDTTLNARVIGKDSKTDLALLRVETNRRLPFVSFGDSDRVRVGDWVLAIGNPYGLGGSVTAGIISARARDLRNGPYDDFFQTDAAINLGNSGGPLFNTDGQVIGINTAIYSRTGGNIGIGFAIPSNLAGMVVADLRQYGRTRRGRIGVHIQEVTEEIAESLGLAKPGGALVASVLKNSPAAQAGIKAGDVALVFDGHVVEDYRRLPRLVAETPSGKTVEVTVFRGGKERVFHVVIGEMSEGEQQKEGDSRENSSKNGIIGHRGIIKIVELGLTLAPLSTETRRQYTIPEDLHGVVVTSVEVGSDASEKGLYPGDVIVEINQKEVTTLADVKWQIDMAVKSSRKTVLLLISNRGRLRFVPLKLAKK
ncbi:HtrA protease/chaperone protein [invertebrate metagenome]|uniref:Probable periplasmic serine endoprotease DegP-like n=1 Tax=invertebrate metagenome TaxID=1711999 RepID=A0A484H8B8_9ZZZZ